MSEQPGIPITVEVVYARADGQLLIALPLAAGARVEEALRRSGVLERCPEIDLQRSRVGIFGRFCTLDQVLEDGDRVEIYRPLAADPKDLRRARLAAKKAGGKGR